MALDELAMQHHTISANQPRGWQESVSSLEIPARLRAATLATVMILFLVILGPLQWVSLNTGLFPSAWIPALFHTIVTRLLRLRVIQNGSPTQSGPALLVSNHVSWSDILVLSCCGPMRFVSKSEVATWPMFGTLARLQRTIFVDRGQRASIPRVNAKMTQAMLAGDPVVLFAEATSSDGTRVRRFRSSHVRAAADTASQTENKFAYVQPVAIMYRGRWGMPMGRHERSDLAWYGNTDLLPHLWSVICSGPIDCHIHFGEPIECAPDTDIKQVTAQTEQAVRDMIAALRR